MEDGGAKLKALRVRMRDPKLQQGLPLDAYIIPTDDAHQSEYVSECDKRRQFISEFTGSAGTAVVTRDGAFLWTDGRYHLQASEQLSREWTLMKSGNKGVPTMIDWLCKELSPEARVGVDPMLLSDELYTKYEKALEEAGRVLVPVRVNLVDVVWAEFGRPLPSNDPIVSLPLQYTGVGWQEKVRGVREKMAEEKAEALVLTSLEETAWLFNLRGSDVPMNPVFFSYALVTSKAALLFVDGERLEGRAREALGVGTGGGVELHPYDSIAEHMAAVLREGPHTKIWINKRSSHALCALVPVKRRVSLLSPVQLMKAVKNTTEIQGMRKAHIRDAVALCCYFSTLEKEVAKGCLTEISAANMLEEFRREQLDFVSLSFPTISSSGPNGAIIHYIPTPKTDRKLSVDELYLCDSGGQYRDGTTDVTRTMHFGTPTDKEKEAFTLVLKGHIALCTAVFPSDTEGSRIEVIARAPLWSKGLNYKHGTGHGIGCFLSVHEGPQGINIRPAAEPLKADMFVSDEPGYYEDGSFGVRIENIVLIKPAETKYNYDGVQYLTMEPVTLVPIQKKMILPELLTSDEVEWLNCYHSTCLQLVGECLAEQGRGEALQWLSRETTPLG